MPPIPAGHGLGELFRSGMIIKLLTSRHTMLDATMSVKFSDIHKNILNLIQGLLSHPEQF